MRNNVNKGVGGPCHAIKRTEMSKKEVGPRLRELYLLDPFGHGARVQNQGLILCPSYVSVTSFCIIGHLKR